MKKIYFTQAGLDKVKTEYEELLFKRKDMVLELQRARELGDLSENNAYRAARHKVSSTDSRLRYLKSLLDYGVVKEKDTEKIDIGATVTLTDDKEDVQYHIVGNHEVDIIHHKISLVSPLGKALLGHKEGEEVVFNTPIAKKSYIIKRIE
jgi:transcription elongation factor GreA